MPLHVGNIPPNAAANDERERLQDKQHHRCVNRRQGDVVVDDRPGKKVEPREPVHPQQQERKTAEHIDAVDVSVDPFHRLFVVCRCICKTP